MKKATEKYENNLKEDLRDPVEAAENSLSNFFHARQSKIKKPDLRSS
jgi:hypothetical protein